ncbi:hypothetical protein VZ94_17640 [Methylocucumis oryzae]|uniref:Uncharacterized protein n=1 Tax=Methylocucumis oryzae TaxID=1632867 RepID=A0A0F3IFB5_9GAMM|nr:hypothetical protein VZ94_17640 [Methylocucumis oryzae]
MFQLGIKWYHIIKAIRIKIEIEKSTKLTTTALIGIIKRGKYTFDTRLALLTRLLLHSDKA